jgi:hypothetical protein
MRDIPNAAELRLAVTNTLSMMEINAARAADGKTDAADALNAYIQWVVINKLTPISYAIGA